MRKKEQIIETEEESIRPSKSAKKRDAERISQFSLKLSKMSANQIKLLKLPEEIETEILKTLTMKIGEARKRQVRFVASLIRTHEDCEAILALL